MEVREAMLALHLPIPLSAAAIPSIAPTYFQTQSREILLPASLGMALRPQMKLVLEVPVRHPPVEAMRTEFLASQERHQRQALRLPALLPPISPFASASQPTR